MAYSELLHATRFPDNRRHMQNSNILEVSELTKYIGALIGEDAMLASLCVRGELSNYKIYPSGHHYFTLKDAASQVRCVMFKGSAQKLRFTPESGMKMICFGRVEVYLRDGVYQFYVTDMQPDGVGDLYVEFERLKEKLRLEGLFDSSHKKPLPRAPGRIAVITSGAGAAVRDIIRILGARWPLTQVKVMPVRVQGLEAPAEIAGAIRYANKYKLADVIITGRGGGSIEDLWAFNDERVARAIYNSVIPVISAVGHEPDITISDFVADVRASTPSNAAEIAVPDRAEAFSALSQINNRLRRDMTRAIDVRRQRLDEIYSRPILRDPGAYLKASRRTLDRLTDRLYAAGERAVLQGRSRVGVISATLEALSPMKVLGRGYAIVRRPDGAVVRSSADVATGDIVDIKLKAGEISATVN